MQPIQSNVGGHGKHKMAMCSSCKHEREARTIDYATKLCKMCTLKVKKGSHDGSEKSITNGGDANANEDDEAPEIDAGDNISQIGKRTY